MAARYAKLTVRAGWSWAAATRGNQTTQVQFLLGGQWTTYRRGPSPANREFVVPAPADVTPNDSFVHAGVDNLLALLRTSIRQRGLLYTVSAARDTGTDGSHVGQGGNSPTNAEIYPWPLVEFDIEATAYDPFLDLGFLDNGTAPSGWAGWQVVSSLSTIKPVIVSVMTQDAGIFGTATGSATLTADGNGPASAYTYVWADGPTGATRAGMAAGTYFCTVTDTLGESLRVTVVIKQDPRLVVQVTNTTSSIDLIASGGLPPYTYAWTDGATTATRTGLPQGTYECLVTDARGATKPVVVTLSLADRYWFSGNPITLDLVATDPATTAFGCEVWVEPAYLSGTFVPAGPALEQPARNGRTTFEVQELLEPYVTPQLPARRGAVQRADGVFCRFFLKYFEIGPAGNAPGTSVATNYLVHGGLGYYEAATGVWFSSYQQRYAPFLTWEPASKKVLPDQPEHLYFMPLEDQALAFTVQFTLTWDDGTSFRVPAVPGVPCLAHEVFCLLVGPAQLGLELFEQAAGKRVASYSVQVLDSAGLELSEARTFVLDRRPCPVRRYFLYANSLGGWNTLVCRGRGSQELQTKTSASENGRPAGYNPLRGDFTTNRRTGLPTLKCYTGARSAAQLTADQDFLLSERVLLLSGTHYLAGQVKDAKVTVLDDDETRRVLQFDFELVRERYYTPALN